MPQYKITPGSADQTVNVFIPDASSSVGAGLIGLVYNTSGLTCYYSRVGAAGIALTLATQTATGAHSDGGFVAVDGTNMPGWYRLDLADAIVAAGVASAIVTLRGAANMVPTNLYISLNLDANLIQILGAAITGTAAQIVAAFTKFFDKASPTGTVNSLPDAVAGAVGGVLIAGTNAPVTITGSGDALTLTSTGANGNGLKTTGNGTGNGVLATGGASAGGDGIEAAAGGGVPIRGDITGNITGNLSGTTGGHAVGVDLTAVEKASINAEVDTAISDARLDELLAADSDIDGAAPPTVGSVFHELMTKTAGSFTYDQTTDSNEALRDNLATATALATVQADTDDIQSRLPAALTGAGNIKADALLLNGATPVNLAAGAQMDLVNAPNSTAIAAIQSGLAIQTSVDDLEGRLSATRAGYLDNLSAGAVATAAALATVQSDTDDIQSRLPAALVSGRMDASVGAVANGAITAAAIATDAIDADALATDALTEIQASAAAALVAVNLDHLVGTATGIPAIPSGTYIDQMMDDGTAVYDRTTDSLQAIADSGGGGPTAAQIADAVLDEDMTAHQTQGTLGQAIGDPGSDSDTIWALANTNLDAAISTRAAPGAEMDLVADAVDAAAVKADAVTEIQSGLATASVLTAVKAKTDLIPAAPAAVGDIPTAVQNADALLGRNIAGGSSAGRTVKQALRILRNLRSIVAGTLTVYEEDDTTPDWTATVTTAAGNPVSSIDPG